MNAQDHFAAGRLAAAIDAQVQAVKGAPLDGGKRTFLFELLAFAGELDRADKQLAAIGAEATEKGWAASVYQNLLAAEAMRRKVFTGSKRPEVFLPAPDFLTKRMEAIGYLAAGQTAAALTALAASDEAAPMVRGTLNDKPVEGLRDADDLLSPILEVMVLRDYIWVPWSQINELEVQAPAHPRDLLWAPARLVLSDGEQRRCYLPALYPNTYAAADDAVKLGRMTDWIVPEGEGPVRGVGQHLVVTGESDLGMLEIRTFNAK
jgi:type VI secretion system protein ImpE